jgi:exopolysaccharide biosynthesis polyprenyl glycosylphosphotransferase
MRRSTYQSRILIVGAGEIGRRFEQDIDDFSEVGYTLIGFVDDDPQLIEEYPDVLGNIDRVPDLIKEHQIDNIIIALPHGAYQRINTLMQAVHRLPVRVWVIPDYFALMLSKSSVWNFVGIPMITLHSPILNKQQRIGKRVFDLLISIPLFLLTLPLFGLIALLIKIDSSGPVFYRSTRLKENGETFTMLKFRTMVEDADEKLTEVLKQEDDINFVHKQPDDPRITRVGQVLRRTSLDELPQLINVIKGEMSLVGPRPELPELVQRYRPWQHMRFAVPQGITGWWQVNGRSDKPMHLHTDEDLYYIQHYSLWLDLQILIKTLLVVLRGKGAY